jgi:hypothetical protein
MPAVRTTLRGRRARGSRGQLSLRRMPGRRSGRRPALRRRSGGPALRVPRLGGSGGRRSGGRAALRRRSGRRPVLKRRTGGSRGRRSGGSTRRRPRVLGAVCPSGRSVPRSVGRRQRSPHCVLHPVPLRLVRLTLVRRHSAALLPNGTFPSAPRGNGRGRSKVPCQSVNSSARARRARRYEPMPKPATVPLATAATTDVCRNASRVYGFEMCTSISGAVRWAAASRIAYE